MDTLIDAKSKKLIVRKIVEQLGQVDSTEPVDATIKILDEVGGHYLLFNNTWKDGRRCYGCFLHIDIHSDGKIWLQHDGTDLNIAEQLLDAGIAKEEIVLGFQPPSVRGLLGFGGG
jgi:hypothetical protein